MATLRAFWVLLAAAGVGAALYVAWSPMSVISLGCRIGLDSDRCAASIVSVVGVWNIGGLATILALPSAVAAVATRCWVSWLAVVAFAVLAVIGLMNWADFWGTLLYSVPLFLVGVLIAGIQQVIASDDKAGPLAGLTQAGVARTPM